MSRAGSVSLLPVYTGDQVRAAEQPLLDAGGGAALMRRAAFGLAHHVLGILSARGRVYGARVCALIGSGNNGGDGLHALAILRRRGVDAQAVLLGERCHEAGLAALHAAGGRTVDDVPPGTEVLIDAVLGTGFHGDFPRPQIRGLEELLENGDAVVVACDLPSGVDAGTGAASEEVIPAHHTVTFGALKQGLLVGAGGQLSGELRCVDIGLGAHLPQTPISLLGEGTARSVPLRSTDHKYSRGVVHILAGSESYPGAARLTAGAAVATGAGMVTLQGTEPLRAQVVSGFPEIVGIETSAATQALSRARAVVLGPGIGAEENRMQEAESVLEQCLDDGIACVVDASGLALIRHQRHRRGGLGRNVLITPHLGEARSIAQDLRDQQLERLLDTDPVEAARRMAGALDCSVLLKGATTIIAAPEGQIVLHRARAPGLATAGTGDVLSGILGALAAGHTRDSDQPDWLWIAGTGVRMHADAARRIDPQGAGHFGASALLAAIGV